MSIKTFTGPFLVRSVTLTNLNPNSKMSKGNTKYETLSVEEKLKDILEIEDDKT